MKTFLSIIKIVCVISFACLVDTAKAQSLPVGTPVLDDYYRREQLLGKVDSNLSFTLRPFSPAVNSTIKDIYKPDSSTVSHDWISKGSTSFGDGKGLFQILPFTWQQQFNSNHPYGWNDEAMIPARGYQQMVSGGVYLKYGVLSLQFRPEFVYAANNSFSGFAGGHNDADLTSYYRYFNYIDQPERFGVGPYSKAFWGQSNIMLTIGGLALGLSNESIWWGPGIHNALILSNNAPGFKHLTFNTVRPLKTFLGYFEGQVIAAKLDATGLPPLEATTTSTGKNLYLPKKSDWRYYTGFNINYHPKWVPGFTLGLTRAFNSYHSDVSGFNGYVPFFTRYQKITYSGTDEFPRDQVTSVYSRWLFTKAQAELYFEYGFNDNAVNYLDLLGSPDHSRAYIVGARKLVSINNHSDQHILLGFEITQLSQSIDRLVRNSGSWYTHSQVRDGITNLGQVIGAGTGSGGNLQTADISWISGFNKLGISVERYEHAVDFTERFFPDINGNSRNWVDMAIGLHGEWKYRNLLFNAKLQHIKSYNYEWVLKDYVPGDYYIPHNNAYNFHAELGVSFLF